MKDCCRETYVLALEEILLLIHKYPEMNIQHLKNSLAYGLKTLKEENKHDEH